MKLRIGEKLLGLREDRKLSQTEIAELIGFSTSTYSRLERGESHPTVEQLLQISEKLNIPIQEFLPETANYNVAHNNSTGVGIVFGTFNYYADPAAQTAQTELNHENQRQKKELDFLKAKIELLEKQIALMEKQAD